MQTPSVAVSEINHYQYCISESNSSCAEKWIDLPNTVTSVSISTIGIRYIYFRAISNSGMLGELSEYEKTDIKDPNLLRIIVYQNSGGTMYCQYANLSGDIVTTALTAGTNNDFYAKANTAVLIWASNWNSVTIWSQASVNNGAVVYDVSKVYFIKPNVSVSLQYLLYSGDGTYSVWFHQAGLDNLNIYKYE